MIATYVVLVADVAAESGKTVAEVEGTNRIEEGGADKVVAAVDELVAACFGCTEAAEDSYLEIGLAAVARFGEVRKNNGSAHFASVYCATDYIEKEPLGDVYWDIGPESEYRAANTEKLSLNSEKTWKHRTIVHPMLAFWGQRSQSPGLVMKQHPRLVFLQPKLQILDHY